MNKAFCRPLTLAARLASLLAVGAVVSACGSGQSADQAPAALQAADKAEVRLGSILDGIGLPPPSNPLTPSPPGGLNPGTPPTDPVVPSDPEDPEPLPSTPGPETPSAEQNACTTETQFYLATDSTADTKALRNRHVLCVRQAIEQTVDLKDPEGTLIPSAGTVKLDARWSMHGVHNRKQKEATLTLRYNYVSNSAIAAPSVKILAKIDCTAQGGSPAVNCGQLRPVIGLTNGSSSTQSFAIPLAWDKTQNRIMHTTIGVTLLVTADGTTPVANGPSTYEIESRFGNWTLRCDEDVLRPSWKGCVFPAAAAVWAPVSDPSTAQARTHIATVFATMPDVPGRFKLKAGEFSQADDMYEPLTRTDRATLQANRVAAIARCSTLDAAEKNRYCAATASCDCDEYPPASSAQGANGKSYDQFSVRRILSSDNQKAGSQMGAMYAKERVLEGDDYWIKVN